MTKRGWLMLLSQPLFVRTSGWMLHVIYFRATVSW